MKYLFALLLFTCGNAHAQQMGLSLSKAYGCLYNEAFKAVLQDGTDFVMAAEDNDYLAAQVCDDRPRNKGKTDAWAIKTDDTGKIVWSQVFGGSEEETFLQLCPTDDGYIFVGYTSSQDGDVKQPKGGFDIWALRTDKSGNIIWAKTYGGKGTDFGSDIIPCGNDEYLIIGYSDSYDRETQGAKGGTDVLAIRIDGTGKILWQKLYGGPGLDGGAAGIKTKDGHFVIAGTCGVSGGDISMSRGMGDAWMVKINDTGKVVWEVAFGGTKTDAGFDVAETKNGDLLLVAQSVSPDGDMTGNMGGQDAWVFKTDAQGKLIWKNAYGGSKDDELRAVIESSEGGYFFAGVTNSADRGITSPKGRRDAWVLKTKEDGTPEASKTFGGSGDDEAYNIIELSAKSYAVAGTVASTSGDIQRPSKGADGWLFTLTPFLASDVAAVNLKQAMVYPTLTQGTVYIRTNNAQGLDIKIYNTVGRQSLDVPLSPTDEGYMANMDNLPAGMYIILLTNGQNKEYARVVKQ